LQRQIDDFSTRKHGNPFSELVFFFLTHQSIALKLSVRHARNFDRRCFTVDFAVF